MSAKCLNFSDSFSDKIRSTACQLPTYASFSSSRVVSVEETVGILGVVGVGGRGHGIEGFCSCVE